MSNNVINVEEDSDNESIITTKESCKELNCDICIEPFNNINSKPVTLVPCGHTFCNVCVDKLENKCCPNCKSYFTMHVFNWTVIGLLPKPSIGQMKSQAKKVLEENKQLLKELEEINQKSCIETVRKSIETRYSEVVNDLIMEKNNLIIKLASYERRIGLDRVLKDKVENEIRECQIELNSSEQNETKLENMLKEFQGHKNQLIQNANKLRRLAIDSRTLTFRPKANRVDILIGEIISDNQSLLNLDRGRLDTSPIRYQTPEIVEDSPRSWRPRNSPRFGFASTSTSTSTTPPFSNTSFPTPSERNRLFRGFNLGRREGFMGWD